MNIIRKAEMLNFRGYSDKNNAIEFKPGVNLVLGDNATGKSTIIALMLFNLLGKKVDVTRFEDYRTIEPKDLGNYKTRLIVSGVDSKEYTIEKIYSGKGKIKDRILIDGIDKKIYGQWEFSRTKDVQEFIFDRFGARREILDDIIIQTQNPERLLWPVRDSKSVGKELAKLLRVEELQNIYTNAKSCEKMLLEKVDEFHLNVVGIEDQIKDRGLRPPREYQVVKDKLVLSKDKLTKRSDELERQKETKKTTKKAIEKKLGSLQGDSGYLEKTQKQIHSLSEELKGATKPKSSIETLEKTMEKTEKNQQALQERLDGVNEKIGGFKRSEQEAKKQLGKFKPQQKVCLEEYQKLKGRLVELGLDQPPDTIKELARLLKSTSRKKEHLSSEGGAIKQELNSENAYKKILSKAKADCPVCDTELAPSTRRRILAEKMKLISQLRAKIAANKKETAVTESISQTLDLLEQNLRKSANVADRISEAELKMEASRKSMPALKNRKKALDERLDTLKSKITAIQASKRLVEKFDQLKESTSEASKLRRRLVQLPKVQSQLEKVDDAIEQLDSKIKTIQTDIGKIDPQIELIKSKISDSEFWYKNLKSNRKALKTAQGFAKEVGLASEAAKLSLHESFTNYCNMISSNLGWIWPRLYERPDLKRVELQTSIQESVEGDNRIISTEVQLMRVDAKGDVLPFATISSHGQRVLASIAFRIAFLNLIAKSNVPKVLVLDEPTIWVDEKNRERLGQVLGSLVREIKEGGIKIDQVIVVSHDSSFLNAIDPEAVKHQCVKNDEGFCEIGAVV